MTAEEERDELLAILCAKCAADRGHFAPQEGKTQHVVRVQVDGHWLSYEISDLALAQHFGRLPEAVLERMPTAAERPLWWKARSRKVDQIVQSSARPCKHPGCTGSPDPGEEYCGRSHR